MDHFALILEATGEAHKIVPTREKEGLVEEEISIEENDEAADEDEKPKSKKKAKK